TPPPSGTGIAGYQLADYLDQHGRRTREGFLGPASLWQALAEQTASPDALLRIGYAARSYGLHRQAAALWKDAVRAGNATAASELIRLLQLVDPGGSRQAACWAVERVALDDPGRVAGLLDVLRETGAGKAIAALLARTPADHVALGDPGRVAGMLRALHYAGVGDTVRMLAIRAANQVALDNPRRLMGLVRAFTDFQAHEAVAA